MKKFTLARSYLQKKTVGVLTHSEGFILSTLERPWLDNKVDDSCIPEDTYIVKRDKAGRHQWYSVQDVEGRTFIEFHGGVFVHHSNGCILVGESSDGGGDLKGSKNALCLLLDFVGDEDFMLTIRAANKDDFQV
jgi:hypothetical protein